MARPENKDYILQKTFFLLLSKGYDNVSITDIQNATKMSRGIIYHYYKDKEALFYAATERFLFALFEMQKVGKKSATIRDMIGHATNKYCGMAKAWFNFANSEQINTANYEFLFFQLIRKEKTLEQTYFRLRREEKQAWKEAVTLSLEKGEIKSHLDTESIATHFVFIMDGAWLEAQESGSISEYVKLSRKALDDYYGMIRV